MAQPTAPPDLSWDEAEYAVRWSAQDGGPKTAKETLDVLKQLLKDSDDEDSDTYKVQYFDFTPPTDIPKGVTPILRQRKKGKKKYELTFKYRSEHAFNPLGCPIADRPDEKDEIDVSVLGPSEVKRMYSRSCTVESENAPITPPGSARGATPELHQHNDTAESRHAQDREMAPARKGGHGGSFSECIDPRIGPRLISTGRARETPSRRCEALRSQQDRTRQQLPVSN
jgi:hypothetical protein